MSWGGTHDKSTITSRSEDGRSGLPKSPIAPLSKLVSKVKSVLFNYRAAIQITAGSRTGMPAMVGTTSKNPVLVC
jgi:hypothetical protein